MGIIDIRREKNPIPNKFTIAMGKLIQEARIEADISQEELARKVYRRRETISMIENGKSEVGTLTLALIAYALKKPPIYFFPEAVKRDLTQESLDELEQELLIHFRRIWDDDYQKVAINQVKALADLDTKEYLKEEREEIEKSKKSAED